MEKPDLRHYGVKGMKWGVRKASKYAKYGGKENRQKDSEDYSTSRELKKNKSRTLSNAEMRKVIDRLQLEKQLSELNPSIIKRGERARKDMNTAQKLITDVGGIIDTVSGKKK